MAEEKVKMKSHGRSERSFIPWGLASSQASPAYPADNSSAKVKACGLETEAAEF
jgi:hypothetical protein